jgi:glucosamine--fructose-6-phosphate aminotransferase (isomerizing)
VNHETTLMFAEAAEAPAAVARMLVANVGAAEALAERLRRDPPAAIVTCARGSSDHAATFAKYLIETQTGTLVASASPSVASIYGARSRLSASLCLAISQSGASPDLLATVDAAQRSGADVAAFVNVADSPLAARADWLLPLHAGAERSIAATKSYICALAATLQLVGAWTATGPDLATLPDLLERSWALDWTPLVEGLTDARGLFVLGRGLGLGVAQEAALKFKETCGLHAEAFSAAEVRHGPMALIGPDMPLLIFRQADETAAGIDDMAAEMARRGAPVFVVGGDIPGTIALPALRSEPSLAPLLQIQSFYRAAAALSVARGLDPDHPPHLAKVTETV